MLVHLETAVKEAQGPAEAASIAGWDGRALPSSAPDSDWGIRRRRASSRLLLLMVHMIGIAVVLSLRIEIVAICLWEANAVHERIGGGCGRRYIRSLSVTRIVAEQFLRDGSRRRASLHFAEANGASKR
jgi:hypothetical protein